MAVRMREILLVGAVVLLMAGCADQPGRDVASVNPPGTSTNQNAPGKTQGLDDEFARCMRDNGADLEKSQVEVDDSGGTEQYNTSMSPEDARKQKEALEKCKGFIKDGGAPRRMDTEALERARALAKCMRDAGVAYPDPSPDAGDYGAGVTQLPEGVDGNDPKVQAALRKCDTTPSLVPLPESTR
jgi:hypothetical protein